jgi:hypothetical protein
VIPEWNLGIAHGFLSWAKKRFDMNTKQVLARFFPRGSGYDKEKADRLARWLDQCGYVIVPKAPQPRYHESTLVPACSPMQPARPGQRAHSHIARR